MALSKTDTDVQLRKSLGRVGYALVKSYMRGVKIKIDTDDRMVHVTKDQATHSIAFDQIEQVFNEQV